MEYVLPVEIADGKIRVGSYESPFETPEDAVMKFRTQYNITSSTCAESAVQVRARVTGDDPAIGEIRALIRDEIGDHLL